jgi:hypothetical protein
MSPESTAAVRCVAPSAPLWRLVLVPSQEVADPGRSNRILRWPSQSCQPLVEPDPRMRVLRGPGLPLLGCLTPTADTVAARSGVHHADLNRAECPDRFRCRWEPVEPPLAVPSQHGATPAHIHTGFFPLNGRPRHRSETPGFGSQHVFYSGESHVCCGYLPYPPAPRSSADRGALG